MQVLKDKYLVTNQLFLRKRCDFFINRSNKSYNHQYNF